MTTKGRLAQRRPQIGWIIDREQASVAAKQAGQAQAIATANKVLALGALLSMAL